MFSFCGAHFMTVSIICWSRTDGLMDNCSHFSPVRVFFHWSGTSTSPVETEFLPSASACSLSLSPLLPPVIIAWPLCLPHDEFLMSCCYFLPIILTDSNTLSTMKSQSHPLFMFLKATSVRFWLTRGTSQEMVSYRIYEQSVYCVVM